MPCKKVTASSRKEMARNLHVNQSISIRAACVLMNISEKRYRHKPTQTEINAMIADKLRYECLNQHLFESLEHAQNEATQWLWCYNNKRPHMSLGGFTPVQKRMMSKTNSRVMH